MEHPYLLQEMSKQIQKERLQEAEVWRMACIAEEGKPAKASLIRHILVRIFRRCKASESLSQAKSQGVVAAQVVEEQSSTRKPVERLQEQEHQIG